jgi:hypothetical protein
MAFVRNAENKNEPMIREASMCVDHKINCSCGKNSVSFNFKDDLLPTEVVRTLYCPSCSPKAGFNAETMLSDNGWTIEYDMDIARFMGRKIAGTGAVTPGLLFDEGYCTWRGVYPNEHLDSAREREELLKLAKTDPKRYFKELRSWGNDRMEKLAKEGWRKAHEREDVVA